MSADYAPWDVNVTTKEPEASALSRSSASDTTYGTTALITSNTPSSFYSGAGGVAYVGIFDYTSDLYKPALTFADRLSNNSKNIAEATSHEIGHNLYLYHEESAAGPVITWDIRIDCSNHGSRLLQRQNDLRQSR